MIDLKPYGAFAENTIRPILDRLEELGISFDRNTLLALFKLLSILHIQTVVIQSITQIITLGMVCATIWMILV